MALGSEERNCRQGGIEAGGPGMELGTPRSPIGPKRLVRD